MLTCRTAHAHLHYRLEFGADAPRMSGFKAPLPRLFSAVKFDFLSYRRYNVKEAEF